MSEEHSNELQIITGIDIRKTGRNSLLPKSSKVLKQKDIRIDTRKSRVIGGDTEDTEQDMPPTIILEKSNDKIAKIIVKCPCGRHSELVCEYGDENE